MATGSRIVRNASTACCPTAHLSASLTCGGCATRTRASTSARFAATSTIRCFPCSSWSRRSSRGLPSKPLGTKLQDGNRNLPARGILWMADDGSVLRTRIDVNDPLLIAQCIGLVLFIGLGAAATIKFRA